MRLIFIKLLTHLSLITSLTFVCVALTHAESRADPTTAPSIREAREHEPLLVYQPPLDYPRAASDNRVTGVVKLKFWVDAQGELEEVEVVSVDPIGYGLMQAALKMARETSFIAPQIGGVNIVSSLNYDIQFSAERLVEDLNRRGLTEEAEDFVNRVRYSETRPEGSSGVRALPATDAVGISIHTLVDVPAERIRQINETEMPPVKGPVSQVEGLVLEQGTRRPIRNAMVRFDGFEAQRVTDEWGRFRFLRVPVGKLTLLVKSQGYASQSRDVLIKPNGAVRVRKVFLQPLSFDERESIGEHIPPRSPTRHHIQRDEIESIAGVDGNFLKVARDLPGLYRAPFDLGSATATRVGGAAQWGGSGELVFRGGIEGGAYVLGAPILNLTHLNQARTLLPTALLSEVQLDPDYSLEYGRAGGGLLSLRLAPPPEDRQRLEFEINPFEISGVIGRAIAPRTTLTGAVKVGVMRGLQHLVGAEEWLSYGAQIPQSQDAHLHLTHRSGAHQISFLSTWHQSFWSEDSSSADLYLNERRGEIGQYQGGANARAQWAYASTEHELNNKLSVSFDQFNYNSTTDQRSAIAQSLSRLYIADRFKMRLNIPLWLSAGIEQQVTYSELTHEGSSLWVEGLGRAARRVEPSAKRESDILIYSPSAWVGLEGRWKRIHLLFGSRVNYWSETSQVTAEPRLSLRYLAAFGTILKLGGGLYSQELRPRYFAADIGVGNVRGNTLRVPQHVFSSLGIEQRFTRSIYMDVTGFYRNSSDRLVANLDPTVRFSSTGEGQAYGGELLIRYEPDARFYSRLSYSFTYGRLTDQLDAAERLSDFDQAHNLSLVAGWKFTRALRLNGRWRYVSGAPYSELPLSTFDSDQGQSNFGWSGVNNDRYNDFHQLDLRVDYHWSLPQWSLLTYVQIHNVYNQRSDEAPHPLAGIHQSAPMSLQTWPLWVSVGARARF